MPESTGYAVKNNAESTVADNPLTSSATTLNVAAGQGSRFPSTFPFLITIWADVTHPDPTDDPNMEITECSARSTDALTIVRGKEGTSGVEHANGARIAMLITAGIFDDPTYGILTKLNGIEDNATADQTGAEIKTAYESEPNAYTDTKNTKLDGIEDNATADQTKADIDALGINAAQVDGCDAGVAATDVYQIPTLTEQGGKCVKVNSGGTALELGECGASGGDMLKSTYDPNSDGVIAVAQTEANNYSHPSAPPCRAATSGQTGHATSTQISKLDGVETGADVTDASNVDAAGAVMESDFNVNTFLYATSDGTPVPATCTAVMGLLSGVATSEFSFGTQKIGGIVDPTSAQQGATKHYCDANFNNYSHPSAPPCRAATSGQTGHATSTQISKLDGIGAGATADQTKADIDALGINASQVGGCGAGGNVGNVFKIPTVTDAKWGGIYFSASSLGHVVYLVPGTNGYQLTTQGDEAVPKWAASSDLIFSDTHCPKCGKKFEDGEILVLYITGHNEVGDILTIPMHKECAEAPKKTTTIKRKVMEDRYILDELTGEPRVQRVRKMQKKTVTKKRMKKDVELDKETGEFWQLEDGKRKKKITAADATEEYEEEIDEQIYEDIDFEI